MTIDRRNLFKALFGGVTVASLPIELQAKTIVQLETPTLASAIVQVTARVISDQLAKLSLPPTTELPTAQNVGLNEYAADGPCIVKFDKLMEVDFVVPDITKVVETPDLLELYVAPGAIALAEAMREHAGAGRLLIATPPSLRSEFPTGMIETVSIVERRTRQRRQRFPIRVAMTYDPDRLQQRFIARLFYGVSHGRQIPASNIA